MKDVIPETKKRYPQITVAVAKARLGQELSKIETQLISAYVQGVEDGLKRAQEILHETR